MNKILHDATQMQLIHVTHIDVWSSQSHSLTLL